MQTAKDRIFETLVDRHRQALTAAAYHLCGNWEEAHDLVQETLLDAYRGLDNLRNPEKARAWLYTILRRKAIAHRQTRRPETDFTQEPVAPAPDDVESMVREIVIEHLAKLGKDEREILAGKYLLGLSYLELADALGVSEGAVRVRCFRAKEKLREALSGVGVVVPQKGRPNQADGCAGGNRHDM